MDLSQILSIQMRCVHNVRSEFSNSNDGSVVGVVNVVVQTITLSGDDDLPGFCWCWPIGNKIENDK